MKKSITILLFTGLASLAIAAPLAELQAIWAKSIESETNGEYDAAIQSTTNYAKAGGDTYLGSLRLGYLHYTKKEYVKAERFYKIAAKNSRGAITPLLGLANTYYYQANYVKAEKMCKSVLSLDRSNYTASIMLAGIHYGKKDYRSALALYSKMHKRYPEDTTALSGTAWSYICTKNKRSAKPLFKKLLEISPNYASAEQGYKLSGGKLDK